MKKILKISLLLITLIFCVGTIISIFYISNIMNQTRGIEFDKNLIISASKEFDIYDINGAKMNTGTYSGKGVAMINLIPQHTIDAFISIEDKKFYEHDGLNYKRIAKAMLNNLKSRSFKEGASTISQQLIKNTHLSNEKTLTRKIKEMFLTKKLEKTFTKNEILETYLNVIYFGNGCYGIEDASHFYFNKGACDLNIEESALLAGIIKSPATYCPINHYDNAIQRRNLVLNQMYQDGKLSDEEYYQLKQKPILLNQEVKNNNNQSELYFNATKKEAEDILQLESQQIALRGYKIYTYYNDESQNILQKNIDNNENYHKNSHENLADSLGIIINNSSGGIEAYYGRSKYDLSNFKRQPGSAIKPILVYAPALEKGLIHTSSQILDEEINYDGYSPNNLGNVFHGYTSVKKCVSDSLNIPAVKTMKEVGIDNCKSFAKNAGIEFNKYDNGYALALGGFNEGITLKELVGSYLPFSNDGKYTKPAFIKKITTKDGITIFNRNEIKKTIMGDDTAYLMNTLLIDGVKNGTSKRLNKLPYQIAGKTGTVAIKNSNQNSDVYSIAYTSEHSIGIWMGNYSFDSKYNLESCNNGGTYCTSLIRDTFSDIYKQHYPKDFEIPNSIIALDIDEKNLIDNHTIKLASSNCPERYRCKELFSKRYQPTEYSNIYDEFEIDFSVELNNNVAAINIDALDYLIYEIYVDDKLIKSIDNKKGNVEFTYSDLKPNQMYTFSVDARCNYSDQVQKSKEISVYTKNLYEDLIAENTINYNTPSLKWYFY